MKILGSAGSSSVTSTPLRGDRSSRKGPGTHHARQVPWVAASRRTSMGLGAGVAAHRVQFPGSRALGTASLGAPAPGLRPRRGAASRRWPSPARQPLEAGAGAVPLHVTLKSTCSRATAREWPRITETNGASLLRLLKWMECATSSLPVPLSPAFSGTGHVRGDLLDFGARATATLGTAP